MTKAIASLALCFICSSVYGASIRFDFTCPPNRLCDVEATEQEVIGRVVVMVARGWSQWPVPVHGVVLGH